MLTAVKRALQKQPRVSSGLPKPFSYNLHRPLPHTHFNVTPQPAVPRLVIDRFKIPTFTASIFPSLMTKKFNTIAESKQKNFDKVKVFYNMDAFNNNLQGDKPFSLERTITKVAAVDVEASNFGQMTNKTTWPGRDFFMKLKAGDARGLSPEERILARHKIIASEATIFRFGGYPHNNPIHTLKTPQQAYVFTMAGLQFEHPNLDYRHFIIDGYNQPKRYVEIQTQLYNKKLETMQRFYPVKSGLLRYIVRDVETGKFSTSFFQKNVILFDRDAYFNNLVEAFILLFSSVEKMVDPHKKTYLKLPFMGMGYFAKIDCAYDIKNLLTPIYITALEHVLKHKNFAGLDTIEIPVFDEETQIIIDLFVKNNNSKINNVNLIFLPFNDVLNFTGINETEYNLCVLNPGDANSLPGNEVGYSPNHPTSVESAIGNNTDIRTVQNFMLNDNLVNPKNWVGVSVSSKKEMNRVKFFSTDKNNKQSRDTELQLEDNVMHDSTKHFHLKT